MYTSRRVHCDHEPDLVIVSGAGDLGGAWEEPRVHLTSEVSFGLVDVKARLYASVTLPLPLPLDP